MTVFWVLIPCRYVSWYWHSSEMSQSTYWEWQNPKNYHQNNICHKTWKLNSRLIFWKPKLVQPNMKCTTTVMQANMKTMKCAETCQQDNLTDLRRNQSPEREILKMMCMSGCCWPFTCRLIFKGMGVLYERILW